MIGLIRYVIGLVLPRYTIFRLLLNNLHLFLTRINDTLTNMKGIFKILSKAIADCSKAIEKLLFVKEKKIVTQKHLSIPLYLLDEFGTNGGQLG